MADKASGLGRVITLVGITSLVVTPAAASVERQRLQLQSRIDAVRQALQQTSAATLHDATLTAQAAHWNNWPKWSKWSNWANQ